MNLIRIIEVKVDGQPEVVDRNCSLKSLQDFVGGYIEYVTVGGECSMVCNEEGRLIPLPYNGCNMFGNYAFVATDKEGKSRSLTDEEVRKCLAYFEKHKEDRPSNNGEPGCEFVSFEQFGDLERIMNLEREAIRSEWDSL